VPPQTLLFYSSFKGAPGCKAASSGNSPNSQSGFSCIGERVLLISSAGEERALLLKIILIHNGVEIAVSEAIGVIGDLGGGADVVLGAGLRAVGVVFIGEEEVELDLGVVDGVAADDLIEVVPLPHHLVVAADVRHHRLFEEGLEGLHEFPLRHII
jgi:hypothetical protein